MDEKQRLARMRLTKGSALPENVAGENPPVFKEEYPGENISQQAFPPGPPTLDARNPAAADPAWSAQNLPTNDISAASNYPPFPADGPAAGDGAFPVEDSEEAWEDSEEAWEEGEVTEEQERAFWLAEKKRMLSNALFILVVLYIICGVIPLFLPFFVSLRVFFWTEVVGWIIIIAWLLIGVRKPLLDWMKMRAEARKEQTV